MYNKFLQGYMYNTKIDLFLYPFCIRFVSVPGATHATIRYKAF